MAKSPVTVAEVNMLSNFERMNQEATALVLKDIKLVARLFYEFFEEQGFTCLKDARAYLTRLDWGVTAPLALYHLGSQCKNYRPEVEHRMGFIQMLEAPLLVFINEYNGNIAKLLEDTGWTMLDWEGVESLGGRARARLKARR